MPSKRIRTKTFRVKKDRRMITMKGMSFSPGVGSTYITIKEEKSREKARGKARGKGEGKRRGKIRGKIPGLTLA